MVADMSTNVSSRRPWTRAHSATTCRAHLAKSYEGKSAPTAGVPEEDPEPAIAAAARSRRVAHASALAAAGVAAPIVEEAACSTRHSCSHGELSQRQSLPQSQRSLTAAVAANLACSRNQPVCLCVLCLLVSNPTDCLKVPSAIPGQVQ